MASTTIKVSTETRDRLRERSGDGTLEDAIVEALDVAEADDFWRRAEAWAARRDRLSLAERTKLEERNRRMSAIVDSLR